MATPEYLDARLTERRNPRTAEIDVASSLEIVDMLNAEDRDVPRSLHAARDEIAAVIDHVVSAFRRGGRLVYVGAGTSGRLGVLDAAECPPTFGTPSAMVVGIIAGGRDALVRSQEGAEDDATAGAHALDALDVSSKDVVIGIAASGTTPYVHGALRRAREREAVPVVVSCSDVPNEVSGIVEITVVVKVGPEALTGSTRLKAGTATKLVLNTITTGAMIRMGKAYGNLMVDLTALSTKLHDRSERIVMEVCGVDRDAARAAIRQADGHVKLAIVMLRRDVGAHEAQRLLGEADGVMRRVIGDPPPITT